MIRALELLGQVERDRKLEPPMPRRQTVLTPPADQSPYFTPPRTGPITRSRKSITASHQDGPGEPLFSKRDKARLLTPISPTPTPALSTRRKRSNGERSVGRKRTKQAESPAVVKKAKREKRTRKTKGHDVLTTDDTLNAVVTTSETGVIEPIGKIHLIQERVRHDPWKMLIATSLLNKTSGRAARPIFIQLLDRWPTPQALSEASVPDLTELLYPLGLFNQRASSLIRFSQQYTSLKWPLHPGTQSSNPVLHPTTSFTPTEPLPDALDVTVFHGAGRYASDSFRIYSDLFVGKGAPEREGRWIAKRERAMERYKAQHDRGRSMKGVKEETVGEAGQSEEQRVDTGTEAQGWDVEELGAYLSDEEGSGEEEWRRVRPNDKELRRYLIWRWGLEGIVYDIYSGPQIKRERDLQRLDYLLDAPDSE